MVVKYTCKDNTGLTLEGSLSIFAKSIIKHFFKYLDIQEESPIIGDMPTDCQKQIKIDLLAELKKLLFCKNLSQT